MGIFSWLDAFKSSEDVEKELPTPVIKEEEPKSDVAGMRDIMRKLDGLHEKAIKIEGFGDTARRIEMAAKEAASEIRMFYERERIRERQSIGAPSARTM